MRSQLPAVPEWHGMRCVTLLDAPKDNTKQVRNPLLGACIEKLIDLKALASHFSIVSAHKVLSGFHIASFLATLLLSLSSNRK